MDDKSEASINRFKGICINAIIFIPHQYLMIITFISEDLFAPEDEDENVSIDKSKNIFNESKKLVNDQSSENLWNEKPIKPYKNNIIPASIDVPPPISTICRYYFT